VKGVDHEISAIPAGLAYGTFVAHLPVPGTILLTGLMTATVMLADADQRCSSAGRSLGFLSRPVAGMIGKISGGHRHLTHSLAGIAAFTALAWAGGHYRHDWWAAAGLGLLLAIGFAAAAGSLGAKGHIGDTVAILLAGGIIWWQPALALLPLATALGVAVHILGDMLTVDGCPLLLPLTRFCFRVPWPLAFRTGTWRETAVRVVLLAAIPVLIYQAVALPSWPAL
jgi:membrane-bound metal-dependent hydrolase YbcI (DUF457 family)